MIGVSFKVICNWFIVTILVRARLLSIFSRAARADISFYIAFTYMSEVTGMCFVTGDSKSKNKPQAAFSEAQHMYNSGFWLTASL